MNDERPAHEVAAVVGLGIQQEATPHRQEQASDRLETEYASHVRMERHLWLVILSHKASDAMLDGLDGSVPEPGLLDLDSLMGMPAIACYVCEVGYEPRLRHRKCPGEASPHLMSDKSGGRL